MNKPEELNVYIINLIMESVIILLLREKRIRNVY